MSEYYLGLDIGTDSVGYAATDTEYNLLKYKGKMMWGSHIFDAASNKAERRAFRTARRRLDRRQQRVHLVQEVFAKEITKVDPSFFVRIQESNLWAEDSQNPKGLFIDDDFNDKTYYDSYPTIHHLIAELIRNPEPHDVRLVYLACAWLVAHRGHFLSDVSKDNVGNITDFKNVYDDFMSLFDEEKPWKECNPNDVAEILEKKLPKKERKQQLVRLLYGEDKPFKKDDPFKPSKEKMIEFLCGSKVKPADLFGNEEDYADLESISIDLDDEKLAELEAILGDDINYIIKMKAINDCILLKNILNGEHFISNSKVKTYEKHKVDLKNLKTLIKEYAKDQYDAMFRDDGKDNYVAYSGYAKGLENRKLGGKQINSEKFYAYTKKILEKMDTSAMTPEHKDIHESALSDIEYGTFMPKQVTTDNRVIPYQVYWIELSTILDNAASYLPFLAAKDTDGITSKEKLESIFEFRIPYFVGPLNTHSNKAWLIRKEGKIYPWNFDQMVDSDASEQAFIDKLINTCTYLPGEPVLPKKSLLYEKFEVLNEINNIKVNGKYLDVSVKQNLFNGLFMRKKNVTPKAVSNFLKSNGYYDDDELLTLSGLDTSIKSSLSMHLSFRRLIESNTLTREQVEDIILRSTYSEDKSRLRKWLKQNYSFLKEDDIKYIASLPCKDFGRLSKKLLSDFQGMNKETGEVGNIIDFMWDGQENLMQLLSDKYDFVEHLNNNRKEYYSDKPLSLNDKLDEMYVPNAVKRPIYRTLAVVEDVVKANHGETPKKIFVEMARGGGEKGKRTKSRYDQLMELYKQVKDEDVRNLQKQLEEMGESANNRLQSEKLFLYYLQLGKCMYSGETIDLTKLTDNNDTYNIDHIYPQSLVKDDSILNNKVLVKSSINGAKSDTYPIAPEIRHNRKGTWNYYLSKGLITEEKYRRLTRSTPFSPEEKWGFINRQLVETRQSTKAIATVLADKYPNTEIVYVKAGLVSDYRQEYELFKSRTVNDLHHAKDAYLNIVVGNVYNTMFTKSWFDKNYDSDYSIKTKTVFGKPRTKDGVTYWNGEESNQKVGKIVIRNDAQLTKFQFIRKGGLFDQMPVKANSDLVPLKVGMDTTKYGGYNKPSASFYMLVKFNIKKKAELMVVPVDLLFGSKVLADEKYAKSYIATQVEVITKQTPSNLEFPLGLKPLKINTLFECDGFRLALASKDSGGKLIRLNPLEPLKLSKEDSDYIKKIESLVNKKTANPKYVYNEKYDIVNVERNSQLFDILENKLSSTYSRRPELSYDKIASQKPIFDNLPIIEQSKVLLQMVSLCGRIANVGKQLDLGSGACRLNAKFSNWAKKYHDVRIVFVSPSGLFESKTVNLLDLL